MNENENVVHDKPSILIVDDVPKNLQVLINILKEEDYRVAVASSGQMALTMVEEHKPDLILLDIIMPEFDGFAVCGKLKASPETIDIPIIFLTAKTETENIVDGFKAGAVDYVTKPFNSIELLSRVKTHIAVKQGRDTILQMNEHLKEEVEERKKIADELEQKNIVLDKMAITDGLTGLYNHRHIIERLVHEIAEAGRYKFELSVIMLDIDHFKDINDTYGHQVGDEVLVKVSASIKELLRQVDLTGRYGGEEFLVIIPHTDKDGSIVIAERIRETVEALKFDNSQIKISISGGVCTYKDEDASDLIMKADNLLYKAKQKGRNRIENKMDD